MNDTVAAITGVGQTTRQKYVMSVIAWPGLFSICMMISAYGYAIGHMQLYFNVAYLFLIISLYFLEKYMPHEKAWQPSDGQFWVDIAHTLTSKGTTQVLVMANAVLGLSNYFDGGNAILWTSYWPVSWPFWAQIALAVVLSEFMLYWAHRSAHEFPLLWRFHAIHHSVRKLWLVNTGRFHIVDSLYSIVLGLVPLLLLGAPMDMVKWVAVVTAFIGMLTHCNVEMRCGVLSLIFNTPNLHRWHHSKDLREGNKNYGENIMLWDQVFCTFFNENRRPPADIGIHEHMPLTFREQLVWPFLSKQKRKAIIKDFKSREEKSVAIQAAE